MVKTGNYNCYSYELIDIKEIINIHRFFLYKCNAEIIILYSTVTRFNFIIDYNYILKIIIFNAAGINDSVILSANRFFDMKVGHDTKYLIICDTGLNYIDTQINN